MRQLVERLRESMGMIRTATVSSTDQSLRYHSPEIGTGPDGAVRAAPSNIKLSKVVRDWRSNMPIGDVRKNRPNFQAAMGRGGFDQDGTNFPRFTR